MSYTNSWSETSPQDTDLLSTGADAIRDTKLDIRERIASSLAYFNNGSLSFQSQSATATTLVLKAPVSASTGNILEFYNTSNTLVWHIDKTGLFVWDTSIAGNPVGQTLERTFTFIDMTPSITVGGVAIESNPTLASSLTAATPSLSSAGTNRTLPTMNFLNAANSYAVIRTALPSFYTSSYTVDLIMYWTVTTGGGSNAVTWTVETGPMSNLTTWDSAFNAAQTVTTNTQANNIVVESAITPLTMTGCNSNDLLDLRIGRNVSDTFTGTACLIAAKLRIH